MLGLSNCSSTTHYWDNEPQSEADKNAYACNIYGYYYGTKQFEDCLKYVASKRDKKSVSPL